MINKGLFTSNTPEWETPQDLFDELNKEFNFTLDVCATKKNAKCKKYYTKDDNGLDKDWDGVIWCNPPYGREISEGYLKKEIELFQDVLFNDYRRALRLFIVNIRAR